MKAIVVTQASDIPRTPVVGGQPTLVYWNILGLAQSCRLALAIGTNNQFVDVRIQAGEPGQDDSIVGHWVAAKKELHSVLDFPNLPYLLDGNIRLSQTNAILQHIGRHYQMCQADAGLEHVIDVVLCEVHDGEVGIVQSVYPAGTGPDTVQAYFLRQPDKLQKMRACLGEKPFMAGQHVTIADCKLYAWLVKLDMMQTEFGNGDNDIMADWRDYMARFAAVPAMQTYMASSHFCTGPMNNTMAHWIGHKK